MVKMKKTTTVKTTGKGKAKPTINVLPTVKKKNSAMGGPVCCKVNKSKSKRMYS